MSASRKPAPRTTTKRIRTPSQPRIEFVTMTRGLNRADPAMRLYEKAKRLGVWNPSEIDLAQDILDWQWLKKNEQDLVLRLACLFMAGEEAVARDLLPLVQVIADEGRLEEEMFLTVFLSEEAKHTDFFQRWIEQVTHTRLDLARYHTPNYRTIFYDELPRAMNRLRHDTSPAAQAEASLTYNLIVEGVLAETGYHAYVTALERNGLMPGTCKAIKLLQQDEARHIAYGIYLLTRLVAADGKLWNGIEKKMNDLLTVAMGVIGDAFSAYDPIPFGLRYDEFAEYAARQFTQRIERVEHARGATLAEVEHETQRALDQGDT
jgi:ribonucleoside-diphosphate reductase beta chain